MLFFLLLLLWIPLFAWTLLVTLQLGFSFRAVPPLTASGRAPRTVLFIPAHNEENHLAAALAGLLPEVPPAFEVIVLADNCSDATAVVAANAGVTVWQRHAPTERGKGFALRHGVRELRRLRPHCEAVIFFDADTWADRATLCALADAAFTHRAPVQVPHWYPRPENGEGGAALSELGSWWSVTVRERGRHQMGQPHFLHGTGLAIPFFLLPHFELLTGSSVEDKTLTAHLVISGHDPLFLFSHSVSFPLPLPQTAWRTRRARWEKGHLHEAVLRLPQLLRAAFRQKEFRLVAFALDFTAPPLFLLGAADLALLAAFRAKAPHAAPPLPALFLGLLVICFFCAGTLRLCFSTYGSSLPIYLSAFPAWVGGKLKNYLDFSTTREWQK